MPILAKILRFMGKHISLLALLVLVPQIAISAGGLQIPDTIAGLGTSLTFRGAMAQTPVAVTVIPPYGPEIALEGTADAGGTVNLRIDGKDTEVSGRYAVTARAENGTGERPVRGVIRAPYGNPVPSRRIELISSRPSDTVGALTGETDDRGEQLFSVRATEPGVMSLRAMDLLSGKLIGSSVELYAEAAFAVGGNAYTGATSRAMLASAYAPSANYGYNYRPSTLAGRQFYGQLGSTFDVVHHFEIILDRGVKEVAVYDPLSLEIHAVDRNGNVVEDYTGTVQIFTTDPEALLPSEVRFTPGDFGIKRLSLPLRFQTPGEPNAIGEPTHVIRVEEVGTCASPAAA